MLLVRLKIRAERPKGMSHGALSRVQVLGAGGHVGHVGLLKPLLAALAEEVARKLLGDLAYRGEDLREAPAEVGIILATERSERRHGARQHIELAISSLIRVFGLGETLATTLVGLATRIAAYTYAFLINLRLGRPQGRIKEVWT